MDIEHGVNEMEDLKDLNMSENPVPQGLEPNGGGF